MGIASINGVQLVGTIDMTAEVVSDQQARAATAARAAASLLGQLSPQLEATPPPQEAQLQTSARSASLAQRQERVADQMEALRRGDLDGTIVAMQQELADQIAEMAAEQADAGPPTDDVADLLAQAAKLLSHQVEFRLKGEAKARVGARLAVIHLLNRDPGQALASIADSHSDGTSPELEQERALITARANAQLGAYDTALAALDSNKSEAADRVRADIMWQKRDWAGVAAIFARLAGEPPADRKTLDDVRSRYVLSRAVALALNGDLPELATLHRRFSPAMAATPYGADFQVIASVDSGAADFQDVMRRISIADDFQAFMDGYRARLAQSATAS